MSTSAVNIPAPTRGGLVIDHGALVTERGAEADRGRARRTYAAIDLGTNNCRLLVARPARDGFVIVDAFSRIVRLDRKSGVWGKSVSVRVDSGGVRIIKKKKTNIQQ